jgi:hypothetical protein
MIPAIEICLVVKLRALGQKCELDGLMTLEQRMDLVRAALEPVLDVTYTVRNGKRITMAMQYADAYGAVP